MSPLASTYVYGGMMSPQPAAGNTGPVWFRCPPCRSPLFAIAGSIELYGLLCELVAWQIRTCFSFGAETAGCRKITSTPRSPATTTKPPSQTVRRRRQD